MGLCKDYNCDKTGIIDVCSILPPEGVKFYKRQGYCPFLDDGPNRKTPKPLPGKARIGQRSNKTSWWKSKIERKNKSKSQSAGKKKVLSCQATVMDRWMAKKSRSYKHRDYSSYFKFYKSGNVKIPIGGKS